MSKIFAMATITFWEGIRNRSVYGIGLFALFIFGLNIAVAGFFMRDVGKVTVDMNLSALSFAGLLLVFFVGLNLLTKDIDKKTIQLVLSKPISREGYIFGKFLGIFFFVVVSLGLLIALSSGTILLLKSIYPNYFLHFSWSAIFLACAFILLKLGVVVAVVLLFGAVTSNAFIALIFSVGIYVVGETIEDVLFYLRSSLAAGDLAASGPLRMVIDGVSYLVPNLAVFDFKVEAAYGIAVGGERIAYACGYGLLYIVLLLLAASLIFRRREFA